MGVVQIGRGIANTPEAFMSAREGKRWNNEKREWVVENLDEDRVSVPADDEDILGAARDRAKASEGASYASNRRANTLSLGRGEEN